jgi:hypothetical protein
MNEKFSLPDFEKIESPFVRKNRLLTLDSFSDLKRRYNLRSRNLYLVQDIVMPGYEWVFDDPGTVATEKLDGTNICISVRNGRLEAIANRKNPVDLYRVLNVSAGNMAIIEGIFNSIAKGWVQDNAIQFGELVGPTFNCNPLSLDRHLWFPFSKVFSLVYKSYQKYPKTFDNISDWFRLYLKSIFFSRQNHISFDKTDVYAEGVVFWNFMDPEKPKKAKLRRDMFEWFYDGAVFIDTDTGI